MRIMSPVTKVKASFGYRLDVIRHSKSIAGKCDKIFFSFLVVGDSLRIRYFMILALRSFFSFFIPPSTSRAVGSLLLQWVSGCFSRPLGISWSFILEWIFYKAVILQNCGFLQFSAAARCSGGVALTIIFQADANFVGGWIIITIWTFLLHFANDEIMSRQEAV